MKKIIREPLKIRKIEIALSFLHGQGRLKLRAMTFLEVAIYFIAVVMMFAGGAGAEVNEKLDYPPMKDVYLANGLRVILIEHHEQSTISYRMLVKAAKADEPRGKEGIANYTSRFLQEGADSKNSDEIAAEIASMGSQFNITHNPSYLIFGMDLLKAYSQKGLDLFSDIILNPSFPADGMKRVKKEMLNAVDLEQTENETIAFNYGRALLFGCIDPLGRTKSKKSIRSISIKDIRKFYNSHYYPVNSILLVIGDFSNDEMLSEIKQKFEGWTQKASAQWVKTKADYARQGRGIVVNKPRMTQAFIYMNQWGPASHDEGYYEYLIANYILGGGDFSSRLLNAVRAKGGMTYHIGSKTYIGSDYGVLHITTSTRNDELYNAYKMINAEIERLNNEGITEEELRKAKDYVSGAIPLQMEAPSQIANKILNGIMQGFTVNDLRNEVLNFNKVTVSGVNNIIRKYIKIRNLNVVIVCDSKKVKQQLKQIGDYDIVSYKAVPCK
ncbi:MAG: pitrilysin family protein [Phycisphaerales bacterium]